MYKNVILSSGGFKTEGYLEDLLEIMDNIDSNTIFYGSSMGAFWTVGASFGKEVLKNMIVQGKQYVEQVRTHWLSNLGTCKTRMREIMINTLPEDISPIQNRCIIQLTEVSWKKPFLRPLQISVYENKEDLINAVLSSMYVPIYSSLDFVHYFRGKYVLDGCLTDSQSYEAINPCKVLEYNKIKHSYFPFLDFLIPIDQEDGVKIDERFQNSK